MAQEKIPKKEPDKIIRHIERVAKKAMNSKLYPGTLKQVDYSLKKIAQFLDCTQAQALMFCVIMDINFRKSAVGVEHIADSLNCNPLTAARYIPEIEILEQKRLVRRDRNGMRKRAMLNDINFFITREVMESIYKEEIPSPQGKSDHTMVELLIEINELMEDRHSDRLTYEEMEEDIEILLDQSRHLEFVKRLKGQSLESVEQALILHICFETMNGNAEVDLNDACDKVFGDFHIKYAVKRGLIKGIFRIARKNLVKLEDGYFRSDRNILLTDKGLEAFFGDEMDVVVKREENNSYMIHPGSIDKKQLFFNAHEQENLSFIQATLTETNYRKVCNRIKTRHMKTGFTILFYGPPGTGKTESVYQLARETGRGIIRVNLSETKDMWYGESEKKVKEIFDRYRKISKNAKITPILLLNEADGLLGKRRELGRSGIDQTENAIQNILLQEMEDFDGILVATTNLTINLDKAFERRFLYKIRFEKPGAESMVKIWKSKISGLTGRSLDLLSREFNLTGGQIENIARKFATEEIMTGRKPGLERIREFCCEERLERDERRRVGF
ncbi:MAG: AAA family ATPase [Bacteroidales bacterium]|nr:AAA family ATPase [Bacteroidales bacterium]